MTMQELERLMVEYGIVIRAIPHYHTSTIDVRHKGQYPEEVEYFDPRFNRNMLMIKEANHHGGKFMITKMTFTGGTVPFYDPKYYDSIEEAVNALLSDVKEQTEAMNFPGW